MSEQLTDRVEFDFIRYANCWEDADILVEALDVRENDRVLSIASAGDNSFALLAQSPELVVAVDVNPVQLFLCELKKAAFTLPDHYAFLEFLGFVAGQKREKTYNSIKHLLSKDAQFFWHHHTHLIEKGVIMQGKFERYFSFFRGGILPFVHSKSAIHKLFSEKSEHDQEIFYNKKWNNRRWRTLFKIFFSKYVMGKYGRDPEFLKEVKVPVSEFIFNKAEKHLMKQQAQHNLYLHHIMTGHFEPQYPYYARREHFETIRKNLDKFFMYKGYAEDAIKKFGSFSAFNLSNIFEYLSVDVTKNVAGGLYKGASRDARFAYWNLMVPRRLSSLLPDEFVYDETLSKMMTERDAGFFYHSFNLDRKK